MLIVSKELADNLYKGFLFFEDPLCCFSWLLFFVIRIPAAGKNYNLSDQVQKLPKKKKEKKTPLNC